MHPEDDVPPGDGKEPIELARRTPDDPLAHLADAPPDRPGSRRPDRVGRALARARRQTGMRDLLSFGLVKMWAAALTFASALLAQRNLARREPSGPPAAPSDRD